MATVKLSIGTVNITQWLLVNLRYTDAENVIADSQNFAPGTFSPVKNLTFNNVYPKPVYIDVRESPDGTALGTLLSTFQIDVNNKINVLETRFYTVGRGKEDDEGNIIDPIPGSRELTDPYFEGKVVASVFRESFRDLKEWKTGEPFDSNEWRRVDNTIQLLNSENGEMDGPVFNEGETYVVGISYLADQTSNDFTDPPIVFADITESITLDATNRRKTNVIDGATTRLVIIAEQLATLLDGEWYEFINNSGNQYQAVFKCANADSIRYNRGLVTSLAIGIGESLKVAKKGDYWEVLYRDPKRLMVGEFYKTYNNSYPNSLLCDGAEYDGDDHPGAWEYIKNLPANFAILSLTPVDGKEACWRYFELGSIKKFWTPNRQNGFGRNLKSFSSRGTDANRETKLSSSSGYITWDYPGGRQDEMAPPHRHYDTVPTGYSGEEFPSEGAQNILSKIRSWIQNWAKPGSGKESFYAVASNAEPSVGRTSTGHVQRTNSADSIVVNYEGRPTNYGEFEFVRI